MILCIAFLQCDVFNLYKKADGNGNRKEDLKVGSLAMIMLGGYSPALLMRNKMYYVLVLSSFAVYI